jgi:GntR family transcriptional regulator
MREPTDAPLIDGNGPVALYHQLKQRLLENIEDGSYQPGDRIPSEQELCDQFRVSRGTTRHAIQQLVNEGRLYIVRGKGTYVAEPQEPVWSAGSRFSLTDVLYKQGLSFRKNVLSVCLVDAVPEAATSLRVAPSDPLFLMKRLWVIDGEPLVITDSYLPAKLTPGFDEYDLNDKSLYEILKRHYNILVNRVERVVTSRLADEGECALLEVTPPAPLLYIKDVSYEDQGRPVVYTDTLVLGNRIFFEMEGRNPNS